MGISFEKGENYSISYFAEVDTIRYNNGNVVVKALGNKNKKIGKCVKLNKHEYVNQETGEIKEYNYSETKTTKSINRCINGKIRPILENNFFGGKNEIFVTFTFSTDMSDFNKISSYFDNFWKRLTRKYRGQYNLGCLYVKELHQDGYNWHIHALIKEMDGKKLHFSTENLDKIWKYGFTYIRRVLSGVNMDYKVINEEKRIKEEFLVTTPKDNASKLIDYMCKLHTKDGNIPANGKLYGVKGGLKPPIKQAERYGEVCKEIEKTHRLVDENTTLIRNTENNNIINYVHNQKWIPNPNK